MLNLPDRRWKFGLSGRARKHHVGQMEPHQRSRRYISRNAACRIGASGFLAGGAIWRDAIGADPEPALRERSVPRRRELAAIVGRARPFVD